MRTVCKTQILLVGVLFAAFAFFACRDASGGSDDYYPKMETHETVGSVRLDNGKWVTQEEVAKWEKLPEDAKVIGIVALTENGKTYCVGVEVKSNLDWKAASDYAKSEGGQLPTKEQLEKVYGNKDAVNATLAKLHTLNGNMYPTDSLGTNTYWSSTEGSQQQPVVGEWKGVWAVDFSTGTPSILPPDGGTASALVLRSF